METVDTTIRPALFERAAMNPLGMYSSTSFVCTHTGYIKHIRILHNREKSLDVHVCHLFEGTSKKWQDAEIDDLTEVWFVQSFANSPPSWTQPMKSGLSYKNIMES